MVIGNTLSDQKITVSQDADCLAGDDVNGPFAANCQAMVINNGGTITPGDATGTLQITGDYVQNSGTLLFEIDGPLAAFYDEPFSSILSVAPASAFIADGSAVAVDLPERIA